MHNIKIPSINELKNICKSSYKPDFEYLAKEINKLRLQIADLNNIINSVVNISKLKKS